MFDLNSLLRDEHAVPTDDTLTLFAAAVDDPYGYLFESESWLEVHGASRQLLTIGEHMRAALKAQGAAEVLHADAGQIMTFVAPVKDQEQLAHLAQAIERIAPELTDVVTISSVVQTLTVRQALEGLYRAPTSVIGIPGVNSYQGRINRYYGLASPSTVPSANAIAGRRHFGEVLRLISQQLSAVRQAQFIAPFYECLPFAERCASCQMRPAERLNADKPICGICQRKRNAAQAAASAHLSALIAVRVPGLGRLLEDQRTPAAYRRTAASVHGALQQSIAGSGALLLWLSGDSALLAAAARDVLEAASRLFVTFAALTRGSLKTPLVLSVGVAAGSDRPSSLYRSAQHALVAALRTPDQNLSGLSLLSAPGTPHSTLEAPLYVPETLMRLQEAAIRFAAARFPPDLLTELPAQIARGTASMYYVYARTRLDAPLRRLLDQVEDEWGKDSARFYQALSDVIRLQGLFRSPAVDVKGKG